MHIQNKLTDFARAVSSDADELISRTVLQATGQHFDDYVRSGGVPPVSLLFRAYCATAVVHVAAAIKPPEKTMESALSGEILNAKGALMGYTDYSREMDAS